MPKWFPSNQFSSLVVVNSDSELNTALALGPPFCHLVGLLSIFFPRNGHWFLWAFRSSCEKPFRYVFWGLVLASRLIHEQIVISGGKLPPHVIVYASLFSYFELWAAGCGSVELQCLMLSNRVPWASDQRLTQGDPTHSGIFGGLGRLDVKVYLSIFYEKRV